MSTIYFAAQGLISISVVGQRLKFEGASCFKPHEPSGGGGNRTREPTTRRRASGRTGLRVVPNDEVRGTLPVARALEKLWTSC
jgi:hypothetical protein